LVKRENRRVTTIGKEMGITHHDFYAELPTLLENIPYQQSDATISFTIDGKQVEVMLGPEQIRELGSSVRLPVTLVTLRFFDFSEEEIRDFIRHFNLRFMKGGG